MTRFLLVLSLLSLVACQQHEVTPNPAPPFQVPKAFDGAKEGVERVEVGGVEVGGGGVEDEHADMLPAVTRTWT